MLACHHENAPVLARARARVRRGPCRRLPLPCRAASHLVHAPLRPCVPCCGGASCKVQ